MTDSGTIFKEEWKNEVACYSHGMADSDGMPWTWDANLQECTTLEQKQQSTCEAGDGIWFSHGNSSNVPSFCVKNAQLIQRQGEFEIPSMFSEIPSIYPENPSIFCQDSKSPR